MNLKEAFQYQNTLSNLMAEIEHYIGCRDNMIRVKQTHLRHSADPTFEDEEVDSTAERPYPCSNDQMILLYLSLISEKIALSNAICKAKSAINFDMDAQIALNRVRQQAAATLSRLSRTKCGERMTCANGYKFNAEGNQIPYRYDVREVTEIDFDRNLAKLQARRLLNDANEVSKSVDKCMVETELSGFEPKFALNDLLDDVVETMIDQGVGEFCG